MRALGILLMLSGWLIVLAALAVLHGTGLRVAFAVAGVAVQVLGLGLLTFAYRSAVQRESNA